MGSGKNRSSKKTQVQKLLNEAARESELGIKLARLEEARDLAGANEDAVQFKETQGKINAEKSRDYQNFLDKQADQDTYWIALDQTEKKAAARLKKQNLKDKKVQDERLKQEEQAAIHSANQLKASIHTKINRLKDLQEKNKDAKYKEIIDDEKRIADEIDAYIESETYSPSELSNFIKTKENELKDIVERARSSGYQRKWWDQETFSDDEDEVADLQSTKQLSESQEVETEKPTLPETAVSSENVPLDNLNTSGEQLSEILDPSINIDYGITEPDIEEDEIVNTNLSSEGSLFDELNEVEPVISSPQEGLTQPISEFSNISEPKIEPDAADETLEVLDEGSTNSLVITDQELQLLIKRIDGVEAYDASQTSLLYKQIEELIERAQKISNLIEAVPIYNAAIELLSTDINRHDQISDVADIRKEEIDFIINELGRFKNSTNQHAIAVLSEKADYLEADNTLRAAANTQSKQKIIEIEELIEGTKKRIEQDFLDEQLKLKAQREKEANEKASAEKEHRKKLNQERKKHKKEQESEKQKKLGLITETNALIQRQENIRNNVETHLREKNPALKDEYDELVAFLDRQIEQLETLLELVNKTEGETDSFEGLAKEKEFNTMLRESLDARTREFDEVIAIAHHNNILKVRKTKEMKTAEKSPDISIASAASDDLDNADIDLNYIKKPFSSVQLKLAEKQNIKNNEPDSEPAMQTQQEYITRLEQPQAPPKPQTYTTYNPQVNIQEVQIAKPHIAHQYNQMKMTDVKSKYSTQENSSRNKSTADQNRKKTPQQENTPELTQTTKKYDPKVNIQKVGKIVRQIPQLFHYTTSFFHVSKESNIEMQSRYPTAYKVDAPAVQSTDVRKKSPQVNPKPKPVVILPVLPYPMTLTAPIHTKPQLDVVANNKPHVDIETTATHAEPHLSASHDLYDEKVFKNPILDLCHDDCPNDFFNLNTKSLDRALDEIYYSLEKKDHVLKRKIQVQCIAEAFKYILENESIDNQLPFSQASIIWSLFRSNNKDLSKQQLKLIGVLKLGLIQLTQEMVDEKMDTKEIENMLYYAKHLINFSRSRFHEPYFTDTWKEINNILVEVEHPSPATFS